MPLRFLFDEHVSLPACRSLRGRGVDVVHVLEIGLKTALDPDVLDRAALEGRIVVTRNYADFVGLVSAHAAAGRRFPGVLFLPVSVPRATPGRTSGRSSGGSQRRSPRTRRAQRMVESCLRQLRLADELLILGGWPDR